MSLPTLYFDFLLIKGMRIFLVVPIGNVDLNIIKFPFCKYFEIWETALFISDKMGSFRLFINVPTEIIYTELSFILSWVLNFKFI